MTRFIPLRYVEGHVAIALESYPNSEWPLVLRIGDTEVRLARPGAFELAHLLLDAVEAVCP